MGNCEKLYTAAGESLQGIPWNVYPRPQLKRDSFLCLNGEWDLAVGDEPNYDRTVRVPFAPQSLLSGLDELIPDGTTVW